MWLHTFENQILHSNGNPFKGRGANIHDTRSCWACAGRAANVDEVNRRIDEIVDNWHANFLRLDLESYADDQGWAVQWKSIVDDPDYLEDVVKIVNHIGTKSGVYVMVTLWVDPSFSDLGWPTSATWPEWQLLATTFANYPYVMYGLVNEPESNFNGAQDAQCWQAMDDTVAQIRQVEDALGAHRHIVAVQGTRAWSRRLDYYVSHPIAAGSGENIAYETHVYNHASDFDALFITPSATLPVIIGEYGPNNTDMTLQDCQTLMTQAMEHGVPHLAWTFHMRCPPNLLVDNSAGGCGVDMELQPTEWGTALKNHLAVPW